MRCSASVLVAASCRGVRHAPSHLPAPQAAQRVRGHGTSACQHHAARDSHPPSLAQRACLGMADSLKADSKRNTTRKPRALAFTRQPCRTYCGRFSHQNGSGVEKKWTRTYQVRTSLPSPPRIDSLPDYAPLADLLPDYARKRPQAWCLTARKDVRALPEYALQTLPEYGRSHTRGHGWCLGLPPLGRAVAMGGFGLRQRQA